MSELQLLRPPLTELQKWLVDRILWRRYDFIREPAQFADADRAFYAADLTRLLAPANDLRFMFENKHGTFYIFAERLAWDSDFFGYQVARLNAILPAATPSHSSRVDLADVITALIDEAAKRSIRYLFASVFPEDLALQQGLSTAGFTLIETRVLYHMPLADFASEERYPVRFASSQDIPMLRKTAREAVNPYDRFHADPFITLSKADQLMEAWVDASIERGFADVTLVPAMEHPAAFTTIRYNREHWHNWGYKVAQTVLSAVAPECQGWHKKLISETNYHLKSLGIDHAVLPTQITNRAVLHNLEQLGYRYGRSEHIFRILL